MEWCKYQKITNILSFTLLFHSHHASHSKSSCLQRKGQTIGCLSEAARFVSSQQDLTKLTLHSALTSIHITKVIAKSLDSKVLSFWIFIIPKSHLTYLKIKKICCLRQPYLQVYNKTGRIFIKTYTVHLLPSTPHKSLQNRLNYSSERRR